MSVVPVHVIGEAGRAATMRPGSGTEAVGAVVAKYHDDAAPNGRGFRLMLGS